MEPIFTLFLSFFTDFRPQIPMSKRAHLTHPPTSGFDFALFQVETNFGSVSLLSSARSSWMCQFCGELLDLDACGVNPLHRVEAVRGTVLQSPSAERARTARPPALYFFPFFYSVCAANLLSLLLLFSLLTFPHLTLPHSPSSHASHLSLSFLLSPAPQVRLRLP